MSSRNDHCSATEIATLLTSLPPFCSPLHSLSLVIGHRRCTVFLQSLPRGYLPWERVSRVNDGNARPLTIRRTITVTVALPATSLPSDLRRCGYPSPQPSPFSPSAAHIYLLQLNEKSCKMYHSRAPCSDQRPDRPASARRAAPRHAAQEPSAGPRDVFLRRQQNTHTDPLRHDVLTAAYSRARPAED